MCISPLNLKSSPLPVSCGQCIECRINYKRSWMVRMMCERLFWDKASFLTLTLRDEELKYGYQAPTLWPRDLQLFIKRLRKRLDKRISFYGCGEYGDKTGRPHYHVILFGEDFSFDRYPSRKSKSGFPMWQSPTLDKTWQLGDAFIADATPDSMEYTAGYTLKKLTGDKAGLYQALGIHPEFSRSSRNPAIGLQFIRKYADSIFPNIDTLRVSDFSTSVPLYFNRIFKRDNYYKYELVKALRANRAFENETLFSRPNMEARRVIKTPSRTAVFMRDFE